MWPPAEAGGAALHLEGVWRGGRRLLGAYAKRVPAPPAQRRDEGPLRVHIELLSDGDASVRIDGAPQDRRGQSEARESIAKVGLIRRMSRERYFPPGEDPHMCRQNCMPLAAGNAALWVSMWACHLSKTSDIS